MSTARLITLVAITLTQSAVAGESVAVREALEVVKELGGNVRRENNQAEGPITEVSLHQCKKVNPIVLKKLSGLDFRRLDLRFTNVSDPDLEQMKDFPQLTELWLMGTHVTDAGLRHVKPLKELQVLNLSKCAVTGTGLADLKGLAHLTEIQLWENTLSREGVKSLTSLPMLEFLELAGTNIDDADVEEMARSLENLRRVNVAGTKITDQGVGKLSGIKSLTSLFLTHTLTTDKCVDSLLAMPQLEELTLEGSGLSDAGVRRLQPLRMLTFLRVAPNQITDETRRALLLSIPDLDLSVVSP